MTDITNMRPDRIIISPGPGRPDDLRNFGNCLEIIRKLGPTIPTLGVCLGHQGIAYAYGGSIIHAKRVMHGKTSLIRHSGDGLYKDLSSPLKATRYHSLACSRADFPKCLEENATSMDDNEIMGFRHREYPIYGVQFHPESILTSEGMVIMRNFMESQ